jgi:hypothetical protein
MLRPLNFIVRYVNDIIKNATEAVLLFFPTIRFVYDSVALDALCKFFESYSTAFYDSFWSLCL